MYRASADPNVTAELHALDVSTAKGATTVGILLGCSVLFLVALVVTFFSGPPPGMEDFVWTMPVGAAAFAVLAYLVQRKRRRRLQIVRHGDVVRLVIADAGVELEFPLECRGSQWTAYINRVPTYEVYLQLIDGKKRSVMLHVVRGAIHGEQTNWFANDLDKSVTGLGVFDVSGAGTLATIREWVEKEKSE